MDELKGGWMFRELSFLFIFRGVGTRLGETPPLPCDPGGGVSWGQWKQSRKAPDFQSAFSLSLVDSSHHPGA